MEGEIDPAKIGPVAQWFIGIERDANPPTDSVRPPMPILDGPLSAGVGTRHNEMSMNVLTFVQDMVRGMTDTGDVLLQVLAQFQDTDLTTADSINKMFGEPRFMNYSQGPGGGT